MGHRQDSKNGNTIDLHGTTVAEAIHIVKEILADECPTQGMSVGSMNKAHLLIPFDVLCPLYSKTAQDHNRSRYTLDQWCWRPRTCRQGQSCWRRLERRHVGWRSRRPWQVIATVPAYFLSLSFTCIFSWFPYDHDTDTNSHSYTRIFSPHPHSFSLLSSRSLDLSVLAMFMLLFLPLPHS